MSRKIFFQFLLLHGIFLLVSISTNAVEQTELVVSEANWQAQTHPDSQGITAVVYGSDQLTLQASLISQDENYSKGEVFLDLRSFTQTATYVPRDMSDTTLMARVTVPNDFAGLPSCPNGIQVTVKDDQWRSQYSAWVNVASGGTYIISYSPTVQTIPGGYTENGFDPDRIIMVGVKVAMNDTCSDNYDGELYVESVTVEPAFPVDEGEGEVETTEMLQCEAGFTNQTYEDSQGITSVVCENDILVLQANLIGQDPQYSKGEVILDLHDSPRTHSLVPIDMSASTLTALVEVPETFAGIVDSPNGIQVFVKDDQYRSQIGAWTNVTSGGIYSVVLSPSMDIIPDGYTDPNFDPTTIVMVGIKFAMSDASTSSCTDVFEVHSLTISPPLPPVISLCDGEIEGLQLVAYDKTDWQPQDYQDSQGIYECKNENGRLVLNTHFIAQDQAISQGEVYLNLNMIADAQPHAPIDLTGMQITACVEISREFVWVGPAPNGAQVFVKDTNHRSQYGAWANLTWTGVHEITLTPSINPIADGYTDPDFDPSSISVIGVKIATNYTGEGEYQGLLYINSVAVSPGWEPFPEPDLPDQPPVPLISQEDLIQISDDKFYLNGSPWFIIGANWRLLGYGQAFGSNAWWPMGNGVSRHMNYTRTVLDWAVRAGVKVVRVGLVDDGRTLLDDNDQVVGYNEIFRQDVAALLNIAKEKGCMVEFTLIDFQLAGKSHDENGVVIRGHEKLFTDAAIRTSFIEDFVIPFLNDFATPEYPSLFGFDIINEPEWILSQEDGGDWENYNDSDIKPDQSIPRTDFDDFIQACLTAIHVYAPEKFVTMGTSCKFKELADGFAFDYIAPHFYTSMGTLPECLSTLDSESRPWVIEEYSTVNGDPIQLIDQVLQNHGAGAMFWNLSPAIDHESFSYEGRNDFLVQLRQWVDLHACDIYPSNPECTHVEGEGEPVEGELIEGEGEPIEGESIEGEPAEGEGESVEGEGEPVEGELIEGEGEPIEGESIEGEPAEGEGESVEGEGEPVEGESEFGEGETNEGETEGETVEGELPICCSRGCIPNDCRKQYRDDFLMFSLGLIALIAFTRE
jgi:hypothetical protein